MSDNVDRQAFYRDIFDGGCATQILWGLRGVVNELFIREPLYKNELVKGEVIRKVYDEIWRLDINKLRSKYPHLTHLMDSKYDDIGNIAVTKNDTEESEKYHDFILKSSCEIMDDLELPYRIVTVCTGDLGMGQVYKNDIEVWMPSRSSYGETHSCSTFYDFQARRLNLRYRDENGKTQYPYTLNNTAIASPRILIPMLEIHQNVREMAYLQIPEGIVHKPNRRQESTDVNTCGGTTLILLTVIMPCL